MEEALRLSAEQRLQQRLSPLQVKFVRMLEMNGPEVEDEVRQALDENPALATADTSEGEAFGETSEEMQQADYCSEEETPFFNLSARSAAPYELPAADTGVSLSQSLAEQLSVRGLDEDDMLTAQYIIGNLDDNGYLTRSTTSMAFDIESHTGRPVDTADVERMLEVVRSLEPAGVGAKDLRDCLLLQLRRRPGSGAANDAREIVEKHFNEFTHKHYDRLMTLTGMDAARLRAAQEVITSLNPKPGGAATYDPEGERARHIIPDFNVESDPDTGALTLTLPNNIPELVIEEQFREASPGHSPTAAEQRAEPFIRQRRDEATELIKLLRMRQTTLFNVMRAILQLQKPFFTEGEDTALIRPMILKDVAAITGYDLSVISRAAAGKYVATPRGVYPLKMFFNEKRSREDSASSHEVLQALRETVDAENPDSPLSDEALTEALRARGYDIARRTVTKYREKAGIPVGRLRRKLQ